MESKARILGHPVHPMLIVFPLGLLATTVIFDIVYFSTGNGFWTEMSYWMIAVGVLVGLLSAVFGLIDWLAIPSDTRAKTVGLYHAIGNVVAMVLFIISWFIRRQAPTNPATVAFVLSFVGVGLAAVTGWLGGELVNRLGVSVDPGAHPNSPSSLSGRPASEQAARPSQTTGFGTMGGSPIGRPT